MKKVYLLLVCLPIFILSMFGCQNELTKKPEDTKAASTKENTTDEKNTGNAQNTKRIKNTKEIVIAYLTNSYVAVIKDKEEIKQLEDLFNDAEINECDDSIQQPYLSISFEGNESSPYFCIDNTDIIKKGDGNYYKSKQISFKYLYSIFNDYAVNKK